MAPPLLSPETVRAALERKAKMRAAGFSTPYQATFLTVAREPEYIHATLQSFLESDPAAALLLPVTLMVGGTNAAYVAPYAEMGIARVVPMTPEEEAYMDSRPLPEGKTRANIGVNINYYRALTGGVAPDKGLFVFEDDICYTRNWLQKFTDLTARHAQLRGDDFLFALYSPIDLVDSPEVGAIDTETFYGVQAVYYPPGMRRLCAEYILKYGVKQFCRPCDLLLRDYCWSTGKQIALSRNSLVQHVGMKTTGLSPDPERCHQSPTFLP